jgi:hypothetical protein
MRLWTGCFADEPVVEDLCFGDDVLVDDDLLPDEPHAVANNAEHTTTATTPQSLVRLGVDDSAT